MTLAVSSSPRASSALPSPASPAPSTLPERGLLLALFALALAARVYYAFIFRFDSDEAQHLHVVWAWDHGLLPYLDIFDNHAPLFQILCAPLLHLLGERADALIWMRLAMSICAALCAWGIFRLGRELYSVRIGLWAALLTLAEPHYFYTSTEFRTDDLWAAAWVLFLGTLAASRGRPRPLFAAGLLLGLTFSVSLKTSLLTLSLFLSFLSVAAFLLAARTFRTRSLVNAPGAAAFLSGFLLLPALLVLFFWHEHAWPQARYCLVEHNIVPGLKRWHGLAGYAALFPCVLPFLLAGACAIFRWGRGEQRLRVWRALLFLIPGFYYALLWSFWPDVTREDNLPFSPLVMLNAAPALFLLAPVLRSSARPWLIPAAAVCTGFLLVISATKPWHNDTARDIATEAAVLSLTRPTDFILDAKAGAIFRPRPCYFVFETLTRARMKLGYIRDDIRERLIATRTAVIEPGHFLHRLDSGFFILANYLPLTIGSENINVLAQDLGAGPAPHSFRISIPATYVFIRQDGTPLRGTLDGKPIAGPVDLPAGSHTFTPSALPAGAHAILFWQNAYAKGFLPSLERQAAFALELHGTGKSRDQDM